MGYKTEIVSFEFGKTFWRRVETERKNWQNVWEIIGYIAHEIAKYALRLFICTGWKRCVNGQISWVIAHEIMKFDYALPFSVERKRRSWGQIVAYNSRFCEIRAMGYNPWNRARFKTDGNGRKTMGYNPWNHDIWTPSNYLPPTPNVREGSIIMCYSSWNRRFWIRQRYYDTGHRTDQNGQKLYEL